VPKFLNHYRPAMLSSKLRNGVSCTRPRQEIIGLRFRSCVWTEDTESKKNRDRNRSRLLSYNLFRPNATVPHHPRHLLAGTTMTIMSTTQRSNSSFSPPTTVGGRKDGSFKNIDNLEASSTPLHASSSTTNDTESSSSSSGIPPPSSTLRSRMTHRAECYRQDAREKYQEFREHPSQSAKAGAKSIGEMIKLYGPVFIGTYASVYLTTLGLLFTGVESGVLDPVSIIGMIHSSESTTETLSTVDFVLNFMNKYTMTQPYTYIIQDYPSAANFAIAWIAVKFTEPVRLGIALSVTPRVARYLGYRPTTIDTDNQIKNTATNTSSVLDDASSKVDSNPKKVEDKP
jgi:Protein of unknown function (DUF1279)